MFGRSGLRVRALGFSAGAAAVAAILVLSSGGAEPNPLRPVSKPQPLPAVVAPGVLAERAGVRIVRVSTTGAGGLVDLRYQVVDPQKAGGLHDADKPPALVDERTGTVLGQLLMGHQPHSTPKAGVMYPLIFNNVGDTVQPGGRVSVVLGGVRVAHVEVR
jgi:hypothetical protein